jgi:PAS domain S-box-containing protein
VSRALEKRAVAAHYPASIGCESGMQDNAKNHCAQLLDRLDWAATPLGARRHWPALLRSTADLVLNSPIAMVLMWGPAHVMIYNDRYAAIAGQKHPQAFGGTVPAIWPEIWDWNREILAKGFRGEAQQALGQRLVLERNGHPEEAWMDLYYTPVRDDAGVVQGVLCTVVDITARVASEERMRIAQRVGGVGVFEWNEAGDRLDVSEEYRRLWGLGPDVPVSIELLTSLVHPEDRGSTGAARLPGALGSMRYGEYRIVRPDTGEIRWLARRGEVLVDTPGARRVVGVSLDITDRKRIETDLREANQRLNSLLNQAAVGIYQTDLEGRIVQVNDLFCEMTGRSRDQLLGRHRLELVHPDDRANNQRLLARMHETGQPFFVEKRYLRPDGSVLWVSNHVSFATDEHGHRRYVSTIVTDVTERRRAVEALRELNETLETRVREEVEHRSHAEEALRQAQKMEAVGQLTGGIAHDFNNLLQGILMSIDLSQQLLLRGRGGEVGRFLDTARNSAKRAAALTHRLLAFSRRQPLDPKPLDANQLVRSMEDLLRRSLGAAIEFELALAEGLWITRCDRNQLENAILNLAINARDAMPDGGRLRIETGNERLDAEAAAAEQDLAPGEYVRIAVADTGSGMPPDVVQRAFDPFFTTKPLGQGTGLGLSMIYGFVRQSEGGARIDSEPGRGTTVTLHLPRFLGAPEREESEPPSAPPEAVARRELILVVEDEAAIRELVCKVLEDAGYRVLSAADGPAGLRVLESTPQIDLLVTDIGLPALNGRQLADAARARRPALPVLFMTGYAETAASGSAYLEPGMHLLTKPFAADAFLARVREILAKGTA